MTTPTGARTLFLSIGGLGVSLTCDRPELLESLRLLYGAFCAPGSAAPGLSIQAHVQPGPQEEGSAPPRLVRFEGGALLLDDPDLKGAIEPGHGRAAVTVGGPNPGEPLDYCLRLAFTTLAHREGGALFHAAGVLCRDRACLFFGPSGIGKSTVAGLAAHRTVLNDDLVLLLRSGQGWVAHATPFGMEYPRPGRGQVAALFRLVQASHVDVQPMAPAQALAEVVASVPVLSADPGRAAEVLVRADHLLTDVPAYHLHFQPRPTFWPAVEAVL